MKILCSIDDCEKNAWARGWCSMHYMRWWEHGDPNKVLVHQTPAGKPAAFLAEVIKFDGTECKFWPYARNNKGYAQVSIGGGRRLLAQRIVCESVHGQPPTDKHEVAHSCGNGHLGCITPKHLRWATHAENSQDTIDHGRSSRGLNAKITEDQALEIYRRVQSGEVQTKIAADYGISQVIVSRIKLGKMRYWVTGLPRQRVGRPLGKPHQRAHKGRHGAF